MKRIFILPLLLLTSASALAMRGDEDPGRQPSTSRASVVSQNLQRLSPRQEMLARALKEATPVTERALGAEKFKKAQEIEKSIQGTYETLKGFIPVGTFSADILKTLNKFSGSTGRNPDIVRLFRDVAVDRLKGVVKLQQDNPNLPTVQKAGIEHAKHIYNAIVEMHQTRLEELTPQGAAAAVVKQAPALPVGQYQKMLANQKTVLEGLYQKIKSNISSTDSAAIIAFIKPKMNLQDASEGDIELNRHAADAKLKELQNLQHQGERRVNNALNRGEDVSELLFESENVEKEIKFYKALDFVFQEVLLEKQPQPAVQRSTTASQIDTPEQAPLKM